MLSIRCFSIRPIKTKEEPDNSKRKNEITNGETPKRFKANSLEHESTKLLYSKLDSRIQNIEFTNIKEEYEYIKKGIQSAAEEALDYDE